MLVLNTIGLLYKLTFLNFFHQKKAGTQKLSVYVLLTMKAVMLVRMFYDACKPKRKVFVALT